MALSRSHKFGQIIGEVLESAIFPLLSDFATEQGLYLDKKGHRACRKGVKCSWVDMNGNRHDLDFVLERDGSDDVRGRPAAFIETAWRRYTKHSRNKAQEIQGAVEPLGATFKQLCPFKGAILAGEFTDGAVTQLESLGFSVLVFPYQTVIDAFKTAGIDAFFDVNTPDSTTQGKVGQWDDLSDVAKLGIRQALLGNNQHSVSRFIASLETSVVRKAKRIVVLPLHGRSFEFLTAQEAMSLIRDYDEDGVMTGFERYEIQIAFTNGNEVIGKFNDKDSAIEFLSFYRPLNP